MVLPQRGSAILQKLGLFTFYYVSEVVEREPEALLMFYHILSHILSPVVLALFISFSVLEFESKAV